MNHCKINVCGCEEEERVKFNVPSVFLVKPAGFVTMPFI